MSITYTYEIAAVDEAARCMEVVYAADGHETMRIGVRLPFEGESLHAVIDQYAPVAYWLEQMRPVVVPQVGTTGVAAPPPPEPTPAQEDKVFAPIFPTRMSGGIDSTVFE